jgi:hypothetical protein
VPVTTVTKYLLPLSYAGFALVVITGVAMFIGVAVSIVKSPAAPWKSGLILLAGLNILVFHKGSLEDRGAVETSDGGRPRAQAAAAVSAVTWIGVIFAGRFPAGLGIPDCNTVLMGGKPRPYGCRPS